MQNNESKIQELNNFLKFLIESTFIYEVRDNKIYEKDGDILYIDDSKKPIELFTIPLPTDSIVLNPINEIINEGKEVKWFYASLAMSITMKLKGIIKYLIDLIPIQDKLEIDLIKELSKYLELLDNKSYKEITTITKDYLEFANIYYNKRIRKAYFRIGIFEKSFIGKFKNIRKKTWKFLDLLMCNIFDINHNMELDDKRLKLIEKYSHHTSEITCPKFTCFVNVYHQVLDRINIISDTLNIEEYIIDISEFGYHLNNLKEYYRLSKWANVSTPETSSEDTNTTSSIDIANNTPTTYRLPGTIRTNPNQPNTPILPGTSITPNVPTSPFSIPTQNIYNSNIIPTSGYRVPIQNESTNTFIPVGYQINTGIV